MRERHPGRWELLHRHRRGQRPPPVPDPNGSRDSEQANRELAAFAAAVTDRSVAGSAATMGELLERWFALAASSWSPATVRQTRSVLRCQLLPHVAHVRLGDLNAEAIDRLYAGPRADGGQRGQPLAPGTIKRVHVVLHSAHDPTSTMTRGRKSGILRGCGAVRYRSESL